MPALVLLPLLALVALSACDPAAGRTTLASTGTVLYDVGGGAMTPLMESEHVLVGRLPQELVLRVQEGDAGFRFVVVDGAAGEISRSDLVTETPYELPVVARDARELLVEAFDPFDGTDQHHALRVDLDGGGWERVSEAGADVRVRTITQDGSAWALWEAGWLTVHYDDGRSVQVPQEYGDGDPAALSDDGTRLYLFQTIPPHDLGELVLETMTWTPIEGYASNGPRDAKLEVRDGKLLVVQPAIGTWMHDPPTGEAVHIGQADPMGGLMGISWDCEVQFSRHWDDVRLAWDYVLGETARIDEEDYIGTELAEDQAIDAANGAVLP